MRRFFSGGGVAGLSITSAATFRGSTKSYTGCCHPRAAERAHGTGHHQANAVNQEMPNFRRTSRGCLCMSACALGRLSTSSWKDGGAKRERHGHGQRQRAVTVLHAVFPSLDAHVSAPPHDTLTVVQASQNRILSAVLTGQCSHRLHCTIRLSPRLRARMAASYTRTRTVGTRAADRASQHLCR